MNELIKNILAATYVLVFCFMAFRPVPNTRKDVVTRLIQWGGVALFGIGFGWLCSAI